MVVRAFLMVSFNINFSCLRVSMKNMILYIPFPHAHRNTQPISTVKHFCAEFNRTYGMHCDVSNLILWQLPQKGWHSLYNDLYIDFNLNFRM